MKNWFKVGYTFSRNWYKERVCFEASMARPRPKSGEVHPSGDRLSKSADYYVSWCEKGLGSELFFGNGALG